MGPVEACRLGPYHSSGRLTQRSRRQAGWKACSRSPNCRFPAQRNQARELHPEGLGLLRNESKSFSGWPAASTSAACLIRSTAAAVGCSADAPSISRRKHSSADWYSATNWRTRSFVGLKFRPLMTTSSRTSAQRKPLYPYCCDGVVFPAAFSGPSRALASNFATRSSVILTVQPSVAAFFAILVLAVKSLIRLRNLTCPSPIRSRDRLVTQAHGWPQAGREGQ